MTRPGVITAPRNVTELASRIRTRAAGGNEIFLRTSYANVVVGQMLPAGAVKGGAAIKLRLGDSSSRFTADFDMARMDDPATFEAIFQDLLQAGWGGFTGRLKKLRPATPANVPPVYVMQPYEVKLQYQARSWCTVKFELGHNEIGDADTPDRVLAPELAEDFTAIGLLRPNAIAVMALDHQVAQKLHAVSAPGSPRAHDLVDLQLLVGAGQIDLEILARTCRHLFSYRPGHAWPPVVAENPGWSSLYTEAADGLAVLPTVAEAADWANQLITQIVASE